MAMVFHGHGTDDVETISTVVIIYAFIFLNLNDLLVLGKTMENNTGIDGDSSVSSIRNNTKKRRVSSDSPADNFFLSKSLVEVQDQHGKQANQIEAANVVSNCSANEFITPADKKKAAELLRKLMY